jgi:hypothetical protein
MYLLQRVRPQAAHPTANVAVNKSFGKPAARHATTRAKRSGSFDDKVAKQMVDATLAAAAGEREDPDAAGRK